MHSIEGFYGLLLVCICIAITILFMLLFLQLRKLQIEMKEGIHKIAGLIQQHQETPPAIVVGTRNSITKTCPECDKKAKADDLKCVYCHTKL